MPDHVEHIVIRGESGYVPPEWEYKDTLLITGHSVEYECKPYEPKKTNPVQKWVYVTNSPAFRKLFDQVVEAVDEVFARNPQCHCTDLPFWTFQVTYEDGSTVEKVYSAYPEEFKDCFVVIRKLVPPCELIPCMLRMSGDYQQKTLWHELTGIGMEG